MMFGIRWGDQRLYGILLSVLMSQLSISSLNDWADRDLDAAAGRWRPVAMGRVPPFVAFGLAIFFALCSLSGAIAFGGLAGIVFILGLASGWAYDLALKRTALSFLPFAIAFPLLPLWTGLVAGRPLPGLLVFFIIGSPMAVAIHLADSMADLERDAASGIRSLAVALGPVRSVVVMQVTVLLGSLLVVKSFIYQVQFAVLLGIAAVSGAWLAGKTAAEHPGRTRWVVTATALALIIPWLAVHR